MGPFTPGASATVSATTTAQDVTIEGDGQQYYFYNASGQIAILNGGMAVPDGAYGIINLGTTTKPSVALASGTGNVYFTRGWGI